MMHMCSIMPTFDPHSLTIIIQLSNIYKRIPKAIQAWIVLSFLSFV